MRHSDLKAALFWMSFCAVAVGAWLFWQQPRSAADDPPNDAETSDIDDGSATAAGRSLKEKLASPRDTIRTFLRAFKPAANRQAAVECLDLSGVNQNVRGVAGPTYAMKLKGLMDRMWYVNYDEVPDDPNGSQPFRLDEAATALSGRDAEDAARLVIAKDASGVWLFTSNTVSALDGLWDRWQYRPVIDGIVDPKPELLTPLWLEHQFPASMRATNFLLADYQWIALLALVFLGFVADVFVRFILGRAFSAWVRVFRKDEQVEFDPKVFKPVGLLTQGFVWYRGTMLIGLPPFALSILLIALKMFTVVAAVWTGFLVIDTLSALVMKKAINTETKFDDLLVELMSKSLKVFVVCVGVLTAAQAFGLPIAGLVGGLGIGGMALALASKDAVANLFGSFTVLVDRPFEVGDWVITNGVEGSVETVGFRSTRIRTFYNSLITLPNSLLTSTSVDNMGARRYRRVKITLGVQYDTTPEQMDAFCEGIRELIRRHAYTRKDYYHVYFNGFGDSSLDVLLYCFLECPDWAVELREKHRLFNDILRLAQRLGVGFAFPTRTLHMFQEDPTLRPAAPVLPDPERIGQREAAAVAGPLLTADQRAGTVEFHGPSPIATDVRSGGGMNDDSGSA